MVELSSTSSIMGCVITYAILSGTLLITNRLSILPLLASIGFIVWYSILLDFDTTMSETEAIYLDMFALLIATSFATLFSRFVPTDKTASIRFTLTLAAGTVTGFTVMRMIKANSVYAISDQVPTVVDMRGQAQKFARKGCEAFDLYSLFQSADYYSIQDFSAQKRLSAFKRLRKRYDPITCAKNGCHLECMEALAKTVESFKKT